MKGSSRFVPNHHDDPIKDVVWVLNVAKGAINEDFEQHLQGKEAREDDVADLQGVGELLRLEKKGWNGSLSIWKIHLETQPAQIAQVWEREADGSGTTWR